MVHFANSEPSGVVLTTVDKVKKIEYLDKYDILLDNQCTASLFHSRDLLSNIHQLPNPVPFSGLGSIHIHERGSNNWFGDVYYSADSPAIVLSFAEISDRFNVEWIAESQMFVVHTPSDVIKFVRNGNYTRATFGSIYAMCMN
jgi:hypothetical protein